VLPTYAQLTNLSMNTQVAIGSVHKTHVTRPAVKKRLAVNKPDLSWRANDYLKQDLAILEHANIDDEVRRVMR
jgi:hypothetical protein